MRVEMTSYSRTSMSQPNTFDTFPKPQARQGRVSLIVNARNQSSFSAQARSPSQAFLDQAASQIPRTDLDGSSQNEPSRLSLLPPGPSEGTIRVVKPYDNGKSPERQAGLPYMLYVPGLDGSGLAASRQFPTLADAFDLRALSIPPNDRSNFQQLVSFICDYLEEEVKSMPVTRPVYLLGESMGGVLSLAVAAERADLIDRIVLVNPATSFPSSIWSKLAPLLPRLNKDLYRLAPAAVAIFLGNPVLMAAGVIDRRQPLPKQIEQARKGVDELLPLLLSLADALPGPTLSWRLKVLEEGCRVVEPLLSKIQQRVLLLASGQDWLIPSSDEGKRLKKKMMRCRVKEMPLRSHALLQEAGVELVSIIREQGFYVSEKIMSATATKRTKESFGSAMPIELPTMRELQLDTAESVSIIERLSSPVFYSTDETGGVIQGLSGIPNERPLLLVGNHQSYALDLGSIVGGIIKERGILPRGLAHPIIFGDRPVGGQSASDVADQRGQNENDQAFSAFLTTYGAVKVGGRNFYKLLQNGEAVLLYPGGAKEAYKGKGQKYKLLWPERSEFIRMAAKFEATIVPFAGIGVEDTLTMLADAEDITRIPVFGQRAEEDARKRAPQARRGASATMENELFIAPVSVPSSIQRLYYRFMKPIRLSKKETKSEEQCEQLYKQVKGEVEAGIEYLLEQRENDPYKDFLRRAAYEASWNSNRAPSFPV